MKRLVVSVLCLMMLLSAVPVVCAQSAQAPVEYVLSEYADSVKLLGRTEVTEDGIVPHTTGAGIAFYSDCSGDITLTVSGSCDKFDEQYFAVYVDGELYNRAVLDKVKGTVTRTITVAEDLESGMHRIEICRETEEVYAECTFESVTLSGELYPVAEAPILIEFVGDSLTCGYASYPKPAEKASLSVEHPYCEIGTRTFAYLAAQELGADFQSVCASGYGVVTGWNSDGVTLPDMYDYTCYYHDEDALWAFERTADVVVINLGSNDNSRKAATGYSDEEIVAGMKEFMEQVRSKNPQAKIVWATGMAGTFFKEGLLDSIEALGGEEEGYYFCELPYGTSGYAGHPSPEEHAAAGEALVDFLTESVLPADYADGFTTVEEAAALAQAGVLSETDVACLELEMAIAEESEAFPGVMTGLYNAVVPEGFGAQPDWSLIIGVAAMLVAIVLLAAVLVVLLIVLKKTKKSDNTAS